MILTHAQCRSDSLIFTLIHSIYLSLSLSHTVAFFHTHNSVSATELLLAHAPPSCHQTNDRSVTNMIAQIRSRSGTGMTLTHHMLSYACSERNCTCFSLVLPVCGPIWPLLHNQPFVSSSAPSLIFCHRHDRLICHLAVVLISVIYARSQRRIPQAPRALQSAQKSCMKDKSPECVCVNLEYSTPGIVEAHSVCCRSTLALTANSFMPEKKCQPNKSKGRTSIAPRLRGIFNTRRGVLCAVVFILFYIFEATPPTHCGH